jgi:hypothetical protein
MMAMDSASGPDADGAASNGGFADVGIAILSTLPEDIRFPSGTQMDYPLQDMDMAHESAANAKPQRRRSKWALLLILPYLGLCFPRLYARALPTLWGFPFFYWYQFGWVIGASVLLAIVYWKLKT